MRSARRPSRTAPTSGQPPLKKMASSVATDCPKLLAPNRRALNWKGAVSSQPQQATTIGIVATNAKLTKAEAHRLAISAHDGLPRALRLTHAVFDGDTVFAAATGQRPLHCPRDDMIELSAIGADCVARAIARGVYEARIPVQHYAGPPAFCDVHP